MRLPGRDEFPRVDDYLIQPPTSRDELIGGRLVRALPAEPPHAIQQGRLGYVISGKTSPSYHSAIELRTRVDQDSDFATDAAILKTGVDPATGSRYLEELAFEVVSTQSRRNVTEKAERMHRRGVRRIFAVFLDRNEVAEWSQTRQRWKTLDPESAIEDPCLDHPIEVASLLDAAAADNAVAAALVKKGNPVIEEVRNRDRAEGKAEGRAEGKAEALLSILAARGLEPDKSARRRIVACSDLDTLERWLRRAIVATSVDEALGDF